MITDSSFYPSTNYKTKPNELEGKKLTIEEEIDEAICYRLSRDCFSISSTYLNVWSAECRISGTGAEYGGARKTSVSGKKCKSWNKRHKLAEGRVLRFDAIPRSISRRDDITVAILTLKSHWYSQTEKFSSKNFPELSREKAESFCRNPNDDTGGPWCYVEEENYETVEKEYCDVAFCDDKGPIGRRRGHAFGYDFILKFLLLRLLGVRAECLGLFHCNKTKRDLRQCNILGEAVESTWRAECI